MINSGHSVTIENPNKYNNEYFKIKKDQIINKIKDKEKIDKKFLECSFSESKSFLSTLKPCSQGTA
jgi:hypothetical protein